MLIIELTVSKLINLINIHAFITIETINCIEMHVSKPTS